MATVSIFSLTNLSATQALSFGTIAERDAFFDGYKALTDYDISVVKDMNALQLQIPIATGYNDEFLNHLARVVQDDIIRYYFITNVRFLVNRSQDILTLKMDTITSFMLCSDSPLVLGPKTLVLREHRDRFANSAAVYDQVPEDVTGEMILDSTSSIAGDARLHVLLRTIPGDDSGLVSGRPYWFAYMAGTTPSLASQSSTYGIRFFVTAKTLWEASTPPWTDNAKIIMFSGAVVINGVPYTPAATDGVSLSGFLNGSTYNITIVYFNKTTNAIVGSVISLTDSTALVKASAGVECRVKEQTRPINNIQWTTAATYGPTGYTRAQTSIDLYDGAISKYVILPYDPLNSIEYLSNFIVIINSFTDSTINENIFDMNMLDRAYSTTVTVPSASYTFTTTGVSVPLKTVADLTITHDRPNTETNTELFFVMPVGLSFYVGLPDSTAMTITEIRDAIFAHPALGETAIDWVATKVGVDKIRFTSIKFGPLVGNSYSVNFDDAAPTVADGTFIRTQQGVLPATRVALNDPKLYVSQFYLPVVTMNGVAIPLYRELIPASTTTLDVDIVYGPNLEDASIIVGDATYFKQLNENVRLIQLSNRAPLYATDATTYYQYLKEYDDRVYNIQQTAIARNAAFSAVNSALSAVVPMVGAETASVGMSATRIGRAGMNIIGDVLNAVDSYQSNEIKRKKGLLELSLSNIDIASSNIDFLIATNLDKIQFSVSQIKDQLLYYLDDLFFFQGYSSLDIKLPDLDSRKNFNYIKALIEIDRSNLDIMVSDEILNDIYERFKNGLTIFHLNNGFVDWNQIYENWED